MKRGRRQDLEGSRGQNEWRDDGAVDRGLGVIHTADTSTWGASPNLSLSSTHFFPRLQQQPSDKFLPSSFSVSTMQPVLLLNHKSENLNAWTLLVPTLTVLGKMAYKVTCDQPLVAHHHSYPGLLTSWVICSSCNPAQLCSPKHRCSHSSLSSQLRNHLLHQGFPNCPICQVKASRPPCAYLWSSTYNPAL